MTTTCIDYQERQLALDVSKSFIVQAPAGSGKTGLLIQRLLVLLTKVDAPEEILAITFTKKAANEMRQRIVHVLQEAAFGNIPSSSHSKETYALATQVLQRDKLLNWHILDNPNQLRIQTIDSLCTYLTKQLPITSNFGATPQIAEFPFFLYEEAVNSVISHVEENLPWAAHIARLMSHLDNDLNKLSNLLITQLAKRDQWLSYIRYSEEDDAVKHELEFYLQTVIEEHLTQLASLIPDHIKNEWVDIARFAASNLMTSDSTSLLQQCRDLSAFPECHYEYLAIWQGLTSLLLTKTYQWRKRLDKDIGFPPLTQLKNSEEKSIQQQYRARLSALISELQDEEILRETLEGLYCLPYGCYPDEQWQILQSLLYVLKVTSAQLRVVFQKHGQIDFIENTLAALSALGTDERPTDLALMLDYQIKHILVDEFQDTSYTQQQLLEKLITGFEREDGRTLFVVGDPMQSIYRFREAEVGLFLRMRAYGIGSLYLHPLQLRVNFRSHKGIVFWNNYHFEKIFPNENDIGKGAVAFNVSEAILDGNDDHPVSIVGFLNATKKAQAEYIVNEIQNFKKNPDETVAILVRSRSHLSEIIAALKQNNIPFSALDIDPLATRPYIQDLVSLTCALLYPADKISWLAILRAPWCGIKLADLLVISGDSPNSIIWENINTFINSDLLGADAKIRLAKLIKVINTQMQNRDRQPLRYWIESTWQLLGGPATLNHYAEIQDVEVFFDLLQKLELKSPVISIDKLRDKIQTLYATAADKTAQVQIMTIHSAKGLEFDHVFLPHLECKMPYDEKSLLRWMEYPLSTEGMALLLAPLPQIGSLEDSLYNFISKQQRIKNAYETDRLLYVAATRAKKKLHLSFNIDKNENNAYGITPGSFLEKLWPLLKHRADEICVQTVETTRSIETHRRSIRRFSLEWNNPLQLFHNDMHLHQQSAFLRRDDNALIMGKLTHQILEFISKYGFKWWEAKSDKEKSSYVHCHLAQFGLVKASISEVRHLILSAIDNTLTDERGRWILFPHANAASEFAITAIIDGECQHLVLDRTFIDESGTRWIIDYKTTAFNTADLQVFFEREEEKYLAKMKIYAQALSQIENNPIALGLYFPMIPAWHQLSYSEARAKSA